MDKSKIKEKIEEQINFMLEEGVQSCNIDELYKLIDIHKDIENEEYWDKKKEVMQNDVR